MNNNVQLAYMYKHLREYLWIQIDSDALLDLKCYPSIRYYMQIVSNIIIDPGKQLPQISESCIEYVVFLISVLPRSVER